MDRFITIKHNFLIVLEMRIKSFALDFAAIFSAKFYLPHDYYTIKNIEKI